MCAILIYAILLVTANSICAQAGEVDISGTWEAGYVFARAVAYVEQEGEAIKGVVFVTYRLSGACDTYHFSGTLHQGRIEAAHADGYLFRGKMVDGGRAAGLLTTPSGYQLKLGAVRCSDSREESPSRRAEPAHGSSR